MSLQAIRNRISQVPPAQLSVSMGIALAGATLISVGAGALAGRMKLDRWPAGMLVVGGGVALLGGCYCSCWRPRAAPRPAIEEGPVAAQWLVRYGQLPTATLLRRAHREIEVRGLNSEAMVTFADTLADHIAEQYRAQGSAVEATLAFLNDVAASEELREAFPISMFAGREMPLPGRILTRLIPQGTDAFTAILSDERWEEEEDTWGCMYYTVLGHVLLDAGQGWATERGRDEERIQTLHEITGIQTRSLTWEEPRQLMQDLLIIWADEARRMGDLPLFAQRLVLWLRWSERCVVVRRERLVHGFLGAMAHWRQHAPDIAAVMEANETLAGLIPKHRGKS